MHERIQVVGTARIMALTRKGTKSSSFRHQPQDMETLVSTSAPNQSQRAPEHRTERSMPCSFYHAPKRTARRPSKESKWQIKVTIVLAVGSRQQCTPCRTPLHLRIVTRAGNMGPGASPRRWTWALHEIEWPVHRGDGRECGRRVHLARIFDRDELVSTPVARGADPASAREDA